MANTNKFEATVRLESGLIVPAGAALGLTAQSDAEGKLLWNASGTARLNLRSPQLTPVFAVSTTNIAELKTLPTIDGVVLEESQLVLLTGQTTKSQNGLWQVAVGAWTRPLEFATGFELKGGREVTVLKGTVNKLTEWILNYTGTGIVIDTTAQEWLKIPSGGASPLEIESQTRTEGVKTGEKHLAHATKLAWINWRLNFNTESTTANGEVQVNAIGVDKWVLKGPATVGASVSGAFWVPPGLEWEMKATLTAGGLIGSGMVLDTAIFK